MPQVSKNTLKPKVKKDITEQFIATVADLDQASARVFFEDFFTRTERLMFAKRLAIVYLLREGLSSYRISRLLKVSKTTVRSLDEHYSGAEREAIIKACETFDTSGGLLKELRSLLLEGFSRDPKKRMKWLNEFETRYG